MLIQDYLMRYKINDKLIFLSKDYYSRFSGSLVQVVDFASLAEYKVIIINNINKIKKAPEFLYPMHSELIPMRENSNINLELSFKNGRVLE